MLNTGKLAGKTLFITGASRGIGKAIALKAAKDGANIIIAAKTTEPHPKLPGTIYTAAEEVESAGGQCLACVVDIRNEDEIKSAVESAVGRFGGIDIVVNNASAIHLTGTVETMMKRYDLMHNINTRGTFLTSKLCIPYLKKSSNAHILNISPPLDMRALWFKNHVAYTMAKFGMSMCVLGMSEELKDDGIAVNALWPKTAIATAAMEMLGGKDVISNCRKPEIMADAAYAILTQDHTVTGRFFIDECVLKEKGITDFDQYAVDPSQPLSPDFFLPEEHLQTFSTNAREMFKPNVISHSNTSDKGNLIEKTFSKVLSALDKDLASRSSGIYCFNIKGEKEEIWYLDLTDGASIVSRGEQSSKKPDVTLTLDVESFFKIFDGTLKPTTAFLSGKLKLKGNMGLAMKLEKVMSEIKSKL